MNLKIKSLSVTTPMKATEQYSPVLLFVVLDKLDISFLSVMKHIKCNNSMSSKSFYHCLLR